MEIWFLLFFSFFFFWVWRWLVQVWIWSQLLLGLVWVLRLLFLYVQESFVGDFGEMNHVPCLRLNPGLILSRYVYYLIINIYFPCAYDRSSIDIMNPELFCFCLVIDILYDTTWLLIFECAIVVVIDHVLDFSCTVWSQFRTTKMGQKIFPCFEILDQSFSNAKPHTEREGWLSRNWFSWISLSPYHHCWVECVLCIVW